MKVAEVNSGPGVIWPTAMASTSLPTVSRPRADTRSWRRKANRTYPLPNTTTPSFKNSSATAAVRGRTRWWAAANQPVPSSGITAAAGGRRARRWKLRQTADTAAAPARMTSTSDAGQEEAHRSRRQRPQQRAAHRHPAQAPQGVGQYGDDGRAQSVQQTRPHRGSPVVHIGPGQAEHQQKG